MNYVNVYTYTLYMESYLILNLLLIILTILSYIITLICKRIKNK